MVDERIGIASLVLLDVDRECVVALGQRRVIAVVAVCINILPLLSGGARLADKRWTDDRQMPFVLGWS